MNQLLKIKPCQICGEGDAVLKKETVQYDYRGFTTDLPLYYRLCNTCTSDYTGEPESKLNNKLVADWKIIIDRKLDDVTRGIKTTENFD